MDEYFEELDENLTAKEVDNINSVGDYIAQDKLAIHVNGVTNTKINFKNEFYIGLMSNGVMMTYFKQKTYKLKKDVNFTLLKMNPTISNIEKLIQGTFSVTLKNGIILCKEGENEMLKINQKTATIKNNQIDEVNFNGINLTKTAITISNQRGTNDFSYENQLKQSYNSKKSHDKLLNNNENIYDNHLNNNQSHDNHIKLINKQSTNFNRDESSVVENTYIIAPQNISFSHGSGTLVEYEKLTNFTVTKESTIKFSNKNITFSEKPVESNQNITVNFTTTGITISSMGKSITVNDDMTFEYNENGNKTITNTKISNVNSFEINGNFSVTEDGLVSRDTFLKITDNLIKFKTDTQDILVERNSQKSFIFSSKTGKYQYENYYVEADPTPYIRKIKGNTLTINDLNPNIYIDNYNDVKHNIFVNNVRIDKPEADERFHKYISDRKLDVWLDGDGNSLLERERPDVNDFSYNELKFKPLNLRYIRDHEVVEIDYPIGILRDKYNEIEYDVNNIKKNGQLLKPLTNVNIVKSDSSNEFVLYTLIGLLCLSLLINMILIIKKNDRSNKYGK